MRHLYICAAMLLMASVTSCVEEPVVPCQGFDLNRFLELDAVVGQGYRLSTEMSNYPGHFDEAGFIVTSYATPEVSFSETLQVQDPNDFSALIGLNSFFFRDFDAFAYIIIDGWEFRSQVAHFSIDTSLVPNPEISSQDVITTLDPVSAQWYEPLRGEIIVKGEGFLPFDKVDYNELMFSSHFTNVKSLSTDFSPKLVSATETELRLTYECKDFGTYSFKFSQGGHDMVVNGVKVVSPDTILSPDYSLRAYELWQPTYATGIYRDQLYVQKPPYDWSGSYTISELPPIRFMPQAESLTMQQKLSGHLLEETVTLHFSSPWQQVGNLGKSMEGYHDGPHWFQSRGTYGWIKDDYLYLFDREKMAVDAIQLPVNPSSGYYDITLGDSDDQSILVRFNENVAWEHESKLYRYNPGTEMWTRLEYQTNTLRLGFCYESIMDDKLYEMYCSFDNVTYHYSNDTLRVTNLLTGESQAKELSIIDMLPYRGADFDLVRDEGGMIFGYASQEDVFYYDLFNEKITHYKSSFKEQLEKTGNSYGLSLSYGPLAKFGDWVYYTNQPMMRVNVETNGQPEMLGAPIGRTDKVFLLPYEDELLAIDYGNGDVYRYVEDRE